MIQVYEVVEKNTGLKMMCRVKKRTLTVISECQTLWLKLYWDGDQALILEECQIQLQNNLMTPEKVREFLNPCLILGFYSFPEAVSIVLPYSWSLLSGERQNSESWPFGSGPIFCAALPKLNLHIESGMEKDIMWETPELHTTSQISAVVYN